MSRTEPKTLEYGDKRLDKKLSRVRVLESKPHARHGGIILVKLVHRTAGYKPSGSAATLVKEGWGATFFWNNALHGQWFTTEAAARVHFDRLTQKEKK